MKRGFLTQNNLGTPQPFKSCQKAEIRQITYYQGVFKEHDDIMIRQKQPLRGVPRKRCAENIQQIYRRTPMPKCNFRGDFFLEPKKNIESKVVSPIQLYGQDLILGLV